MVKQPIGLADILQSFILLHPDDDVKKIIAQKLGFYIATESQEEPLTPHPDVSADKKSDEKGEESLPYKSEEINNPPDRDNKDVDEQDIRDIEIIPEQGTSSFTPQWIVDVKPLDSDPAPEFTKVYSEHMPLIIPREMRTVLFDSVSIKVNEGKINLNRLIKIMANGKFPSEIPRYPVRTIRKGFAVYIDKSESMDPYKMDQTWFLSQLRNLVPDIYREMFFFKGTPMWIYSKWNISKRKFSFSRYIKPIILLTDLGIGKPLYADDNATVSEWQSFLSPLVKKGFPIAVFNPYKYHRIPSTLRKDIQIIKWDRAGVKNPYSIKRIEPPENNQELADEIKKIDQDILKFAKLLSPAVRVEHELLREVRLRFFPDTGAGIEADLWFSPLVESKSSLGIVLKPEVLQFLRKELKKDDNNLVTRLWKLIKDFRKRKHTSTVIQLEEEINYLSLYSKGNTNEEINTIFKRIMKSIVQGERKGLWKWFLHISQRLPESEKNNDVLQTLTFTAKLHDPNHILSEHELPAKKEDYDWFINKITEKTDIGIRCDNFNIELSYPPVKNAYELAIPKTNPLFIFLLKNNGKEKILKLNHGEIKSASWQKYKKIQFLDGHVYRIQKKEDILSKPEVFICYAWDGDESEQIAGQIYTLLQSKNFNVVKDNKDLHYKGNIDDFEARIGRGSYIITIISDKYLISEHCMNEMLYIQNRGDVYDRIFPVVLKNADIYSRSGRLKYLKHWNNEIQTFKKELNELGITGGAEHSMKDLTRLEQIKLVIGSITDLLSQMLTLTPEKHQQSNFSDLLGALEKQAAKDDHENQRLGNNQNDGEPAETDEHISLLSGEDQKADEKQALLRILHVSDLHFTCPGKQGDVAWAVEAFNGDMVNRAMLTKIGQLADEGMQPDLIVITGNVAHSGKADEYGVASVFFNRLLAETKLKKDRLFVVPGNQDVDKDEIDEVLGRSIYEFTTQDDITKILTHKALFPHLMNKFTHYFDFANTTMGSRYYTGELFYYTEAATIVKNNTRFLINLAGINSALFSRHDEDKDTKLACGIYQVNKVINQLDPAAALNIGFLHHPLSSLHTMDKPAANMLINTMDILLSGHLEDPDASFSHTAAGKAVMLCAGSSFTKRDAFNSFEMIELDMATGNGKALFYKYLPDNNLWKVNTDVNPATTDGSFSFSISLKRAIKPDSGGPDRSTGNQAGYLRWLYDECAYINIRGIVARAKHAYQFTIDEFYIPLTSTSYFPQRDEKAGFDPGKHRPGSDISLDKALMNQYTTIVGDPGSGKTTYVRRICYILAKGLLKDDNSHETLGLAKGMFPVFIKIEELARFISQSRTRNRPDTPVLDAASGWLVSFLNEKSKELGWDLPREFFKHRLESEKTIVVLDGLDEAPDITVRQQISNIVLTAIATWPACKFIVTTRPHAYKGTIVLEKFTEFSIAPLREAAIDGFLLKWAQTLTGENLLTATTDAYYDELKNALRTRPAMQRMTCNPIMLTALAVVHWNERKLPEGRAILYHSIINWLIISRIERPGRLTGDTCRSHLQKIALAMQMHPAGRQVNAGRRWAAEQIYTDFPGKNNEEKRKMAEQFIEQEEVDSGLIVSRGNNLTFWHLTFQEYLAALALCEKMESEQQDLLIKPEILHNPDWQEVLLLFGSILYNQGTDKIDGFLAAILTTTNMTEKNLADEARCVGLIGAIIRDVPADNYLFQNTLYKEMLTRVMEIFDKNKALTIPLDVRVAAADALGQAGDMRFAHPEKNWIEIPEGTFLMGAQKEDPGKPNYDPDAIDNESPVHEVTLSSYNIGKYLVTVGEYYKFIQADGYHKEEFWKAGGFGEFNKPGYLETQIQFPTRPVVEVSWFEASAYVTWLGPGYSLPTEAQWERAARGSGGKYKKYPWGNSEPNEGTTNWGKGNANYPSPVGIFPNNATEEGIYDMGGNVWEWCLDWIDVSTDNGSVFYEKTSGNHNPLNNESGKLGKVGNEKSRILRGGAWDDYFYVNILRCCYRNNLYPDNRNGNVGFRVVFST